MNTKGAIFDIMKFAIHDGPGIRTNVFLKGCPLKCLWCHNPESQKSTPELSFIPDRCIGCGYCLENCASKAHRMKEGQHVFFRDVCEQCGSCARKCHAKALEVIGRDVTVAEVLKEVLKDQSFYETSNGGMTISGGEPMMQFDFTAALLQAGKEAGLHCCLDTCGFAPAEQYLELLKNVDLFLYDIKDTDPERHLKNTGVPLSPILENLTEIDKAGGKTILRCPLIPEINTDDAHLKEIAKIVNSLNNVIEITLHPYHPLGRSKSERIGEQYPLEDTGFAENESMEHCLEVVSANTTIPVRKN